MKRVVITGATSFIGIHLIEEWLRKDCEIFAVVRPDSNRISRLPKSPRLQIVELDMNHYAELSNEIGEADCFYHLAWNGVRAPFRDDAALQKNNYQCSMEAIHQAEKMECSFFLGSGSQAEYGKMPEAVDEEFKCQPITEYGINKLRTCEAALECAKRGSLRVIWTRIFSIYGKYDFPNSLVMSSIAKMKENKPVDLTAGTQLWDYLYVKDAVRFMVKFAFSDCASGVYNLASGEVRPLKEYIKDIHEITGSNSELRFGAIPYGPAGPLNLQPDIHKACNAGIIDYVTPFTKGISEMLSM